VVVELTVSAKVKPAEIDAVKQTLYDRVGAMIGRTDQAFAASPAE
jgi:hypothetical protein